jgi:hypothetical protein
MAATPSSRKPLSRVALACALALSLTALGPFVRAQATQGTQTSHEAQPSQGQAAGTTDEAAASGALHVVDVAGDLAQGAQDAYAAKVEARREQDLAQAAEREKDEELASWAARIDAYLAGSPLEGYGETFARAALEAGVDPRLSPAIAEVESGKGAVCYASHNAWGWGGVGWSDWESAIQAHVSGMAASYSSAMAEGDFGLTASRSMAARYCGVSAEAWYQQVSAAMERI